MGGGLGGDVGIFGKREKMGSREEGCGGLGRIVRGGFFGVEGGGGGGY